MEYTTLGKTGLKVSVVGLGCGGPSRLGLRDNADSQSAPSELSDRRSIWVSTLSTPRSPMEPKELSARQSRESRAIASLSPPKRLSRTLANEIPRTKSRKVWSKV